MLFPLVIGTDIPKPHESLQNENVVASLESVYCAGITTVVCPPLGL